MLKLATILQAWISKFPKNRVLNNLLGQSLLALNFHKEGLSYIRKGAGFLQLDENGVNVLEWKGLI